jgi:eukaryotic-like serine/threonine-protein kinase
VTERPAIREKTVARLQEACERPEFTGTRYQLGPELGRGGMGVVYEVLDTELGRHVALKVVPAWEAGVNAALERIRQEARTLAALEHPGIVAVHDLGTLADGRIFYTMRLMRGERLGARGADGEDRSVPEIVRLVARICETVQFAHAQGVIHRDLKPDNVMLGPFGEVVVLDWGIARLAAAPGDGGGRAGTREFTAPEQLAGREDATDARSDVYSLGCILRALLRPTERKIARPLLSIIAKATATARDARYASARDLGEDLLGFLDGFPVEAHRETWFERVSRLFRRHQLLVTLILTYVVMRIVIFFLLSR